MTTLFSRRGVALAAVGEALVVSGDLGTGVAAALADTGERWLERAEAASLTLDLSGVERASSAAISVLLQWLRVCRRRGVVVSEVRLSAPLRRLTTLAELDALFDHPAA
ncbi:STAS domain-containing protein [Halomonas piscis]|uniref:STAS domain-containing protein n=1 Tax=Halomonas piscis TaxID=3031727 RepID=A0ABY9Z330_9GAMM|nr:STAS domain-containing protein [Halomonas piscis]WNK21401.1 STAS domain-containing protein [Halomonas piscis]